MEDVEDREELRKQLTKKDSEARLAAELGKQLLEANNALQAQIENCSKEFYTEKEILLQENYTLQTKLDHKCSLEKSYEEEIDSLKRALRRAQAESKENAEQFHKTEIDQWKAKVEALETELEQASGTIRQIKQRNDELSEALSSLHKHFEESAVAQVQGAADELEEVQAKLKHQEAENIKYSQHIADLQNEIKILVYESSNLDNNLTAKIEDLKDKEKDIISLSNALRESREEAQELKAEVQMLKFENQDHKQKGNSLFGEVEDRRIEAEKKLISIETQYESLKRQHEQTKQQLLKLKLQLAGFLNYTGHKTDSQYIERLQEQLSQAKSEIQNLTQTLAGQTECKPNFEEEQEQKDADGNPSNHVQSLFHAKEERFKALQEQAKMKHLLLLAESDKVTQCEQKLYSAERDLEQFKANNVKLALKLEEIQMKYEPDKLKKELRKRCTGVEEKIPLDDEMKPTVDWIAEKGNKKTHSSTDAQTTKQVDEKTTAETVIASLFENNDKENCVGSEQSNARSIMEELWCESEGLDEELDFKLEGRKAMTNMDTNEKIPSPCKDEAGDHGDQAMFALKQCESQNTKNVTHVAVTHSHSSPDVADNLPASGIKQNFKKFNKASDAPGDCKTQ